MNGKGRGRREVFTEGSGAGEFRSRRGGAGKAHLPGVFGTVRSPRSRQRNERFQASCLSERLHSGPRPVSWWNLNQIPAGRRTFRFAALRMTSKSKKTGDWRRDTGGRKGKGLTLAASLHTVDRLPLTPLDFPACFLGFSSHPSPTNRIFPPTIVIAGFTSSSFSGGVL